MKLVRFEYNGEQKSGIVKEDVIREISGSFYEGYSVMNNTYKADDVRILAPCTPSKVVAVGKNYVDHINEMGGEMPQNPTLFIKLPHTIIGHGDNILIPKTATRVDYEAELAVVIKKECSKVSPEEVDEYLLGATCLNDVTERHIQKSDGQWTRAKNFETFCPIGPYIVDDIDYNSLDIKLLLNGEVKQSSNTSNLLWNVQTLVSFISNVIPLQAGDMVTTGTPSGISPMKDGDVVEVVIEKVGTLKNYVKQAY